MIHPALLVADPPLTPRTVSAIAARWEVRLLGGFALDDGQRQHHRLHSRYGVALVARLALWPERHHAREELIELLWPGVALGVGRNRLRQTLSVLRQVLEPPGSAGVPVLQADRSHIRVVPNALACDVQGFERSLAAGDRGAALALYRGELLPGFYDEWVLVERERLKVLAERAAAGSAFAGSSWPPTAPAPLVGPAGIVRSTTVGPTPPVRFDGAGAVAARADAAPPVSFGRGLPAPLTRLFGTEEAVARLAEDVSRHRLVTLLGPGGAGKTRLALETARWLEGPVGSAGASRPDRFEIVVWVPLVDARTFLEVEDALRRALQLDSRGEVIESLCARLAGRRGLLVLDNFEQLVDAATGLVAALAARLPGLHLLLTSRRSLGLDGERQVGLEPVCVPAADASLEAARASPAVALFVERAQAVRADFRLSARNHRAVVGLVRLVQGMPLAIELAASRARSYTPQELLETLARPAPPGGPAQALELLARRGSRGAHDPRHASMERTISWSWDLLDADEQAAARAMTVFHGGCTAVMLAAVLQQGGGDAHALLDRVVGHSLAQAQTARADDEADGDAGPMRFALYQPIRDFALARVDPPAAEAMRARHRDWAIDWARRLGVTPDLDRVRTEMPNLVAAFASALDDGAFGAAAELLLALAPALEVVELPSAVLGQVCNAVAKCADASLRCRAQAALGPLLFDAGMNGLALEQAHLAHGASAELPSHAGADQAVLHARAAYGLARVLWRSDLSQPVRAEPLIAQALKAAQGAGDLALLADIVALQASLCQPTDPAAALELHQRALALRSEHGNAHALHSSRYQVAVGHFEAGRVDSALAQCRALAADVRVQRNWKHLGVVLCAEGTILVKTRRWAQAAAALRVALAVAWEPVAMYPLAYILWNLPHALVHDRDPAIALAIATFAARFWQRFGALTPDDERYLRRIDRLAAVQMPPAVCAAAKAQGATIELAEAVALALRADRPTEPGAGKH